MDIDVTKELRKVNLIESLQEDHNFSEDFATQIAEDLLEPQEPAYTCRTREELTAAIQDMVSSDEDEIDERD